MRGSVLLLGLLFGACSPAPVLNPHKAPVSGAPIARTERPVLTSAPGGTVISREGAPVELATMWASQAVVIVFYKGHWCPPCQRQLAELEQRRVEFTAAGATLIAISSDEPEQLPPLRAKLALGFELYADPQLNVIRLWGVADGDLGISRPATFIVAPGGEIVFSHIGATEADRPELQDLLDAVPRAK